MSDYIPSKETAKILWLWNLATWLTVDDCANALAHGFTWDQACGFYFTVLQATLARLDTEQKHALAQGKKFEG